MIKEKLAKLEELKLNNEEISKQISVLTEEIETLQNIKKYVETLRISNAESASFIKIYYIKNAVENLFTTVTLFVIINHESIKSIKIDKSEVEIFSLLKNSKELNFEEAKNKFSFYPGIFDLFMESLHRFNS